MVFSLEMYSALNTKVYIGPESQTIIIPNQSTYTLTPQ
jgi:hypothetical protein